MPRSRICSSPSTPRRTDSKYLVSNMRCFWPLFSSIACMVVGLWPACWWDPGASLCFASATTSPWSLFMWRGQGRTTALGNHGAEMNAFLCGQWLFFLTYGGG